MDCRVISAFTRVFRRAMPGNDEMGHYNDTTCRTHFPLDSRNENLPEKRIHRNYVETPGRDTAPGFLLRGRSRPRAAYFFRCRKGDKSCSFTTAKQYNPPPGPATPPPSSCNTGRGP